MSDLIDRQAAIDAMLRLQSEDEELYGCRIPEGFDGDRATEELKKLPSAETEIIMCKYCAYGKPVEGDEEHRVDCAHGIIGWEETNIHGVNWFCADAERREDEAR